MIGKRRLTDEEIDEIASREYKVQNKRKYTIRIDNERSPEEIAKITSKIKCIKNLSGPKTLEGKKRSLKNLKPGGYPKQLVKHGGYIRKVLDEHELEFYNMRKETYLNEFDLNSSSDEILLNMVLVDEVIIYRLLSKQIDQPTLNIDRPFSEAQGRLHKNLDGLAMLRKQRITQDRMDRQTSIVQLAQEVARQKSKILQQIQEEEEEERLFLENRTIDVEAAPAVGGDEEVGEN